MESAKMSLKHVNNTTWPMYGLARGWVGRISQVEKKFFWAVLKGEEESGSVMERVHNKEQEQNLLEEQRLLRFFKKNQEYQVDSLTLGDNN